MNRKCEDPEHSSVVASYLCAIQLRDSGKVEQALDALKGLAKMRLDADKKASVLSAEATCYMMMGRLGEARTTMNQALTLLPLTSPLAPAVQLMDAALLVQEGELQSAKRKYESLLKSSDLDTPQSRELWIDAQSRYAMLLVHLKEWTQAVYQLERALSWALEPQDEQNLRIHLGICYEELKELDKAKQQYELAARLNLDNALKTEIHFRLGSIFYRLGQLEDALREMQRAEMAIKTSTLSARQLYEMLAKLYLATGNDARAQEYTRKIHSSQREH